MVLRPEIWIRESVTQREGINTLHVHRTRWDPRLLALFNGCVDIFMLHCYLLLFGNERNEEKWNREEKGNGTKEYSPSIALVPTYLKRMRIRVP